jgi:hypothetical protein
MGETHRRISMKKLYPFKSLRVEDVKEIIRLTSSLNKTEPGGILRFPSKEADELVEKILNGPSPEYSALHGKIESLSQEALLELMALMWVGRDGGDFKDQLEDAGKNSSEGDVVYITGKSLVLADYLKDGLEAVAFS